MGVEGPVIIGGVFGGAVGRLFSGGACCCSTTVMVNDFGTAVLPDESVAVHVTVVSPIGKIEPEGGLQTGTIRPSTSSVADGCGYGTGAPEELVALTLIGEGGRVITGGILSGLALTVIAKLVIFFSIPCSGVAVIVAVYCPGVIVSSVAIVKVA